MYKIDHSNTFSKRFNDLIKMNGISVKNLAENTGISKSSLYDYLAGIHSPLSRHIVILSAYFGVSANWLMGYDDEIITNDEKNIIKSIDEFLNKKGFNRGDFDNNKTTNTYYDLNTDNIVVISLVNPSNPLYESYRMMHEKNN